MGIERNDEPRWGHECPRTEIDGVAANHPTEEQIEPLAGAPSRWPRKEVADAASRGGLVRRTGLSGGAGAIRGREIRVKCASGERIECRTDVWRRRIVAFDEKSFNAASFAQHALQHEHQRDEVAASNPAMHQRVDRVAMTLRIEGADERCRMRSHRDKQRLDGVEDAGDPAEREPSGTEAYDLLVLRR